VTDEPAKTLADGSQPATPEALLTRLSHLEITQKTLRHQAVFTVEEAKTLRANLPGGHTKNLFLRNKKGAMWLVTCLEDRQIDLKVLGEKLAAGRFSFGSAARLMQFLGVTPGAVTPFAVINDKARQVTQVLDKGLFDHQLLNFHPLDNCQTTAITAEDLLTFLAAENHAPIILDLAAMENPA
jgi:Ala-tRNA(Pro) deacylase|tara:strand:- start:3360 stop:3908 length:549 start_codon:yes stop_codon:yes gene_type:complete